MKTPFLGRVAFETLLLGVLAIVFASAVFLTTCLFAMVLMSLHAAARTWLLLDRGFNSPDQVRRLLQRPHFS